MVRDLGNQQADFDVRLRHSIIFMYLDNGGVKSGGHHARPLRYIVDFGHFGLFRGQKPENFNYF